MAKFDTQNWKLFSMASLFDMELSKDDLQPKKLRQGVFPLVSSGKTNNGICALIEKQNNACLYEAGILTIDMFGKVFYQAKPFYSVSHGRVVILKPKFDLNCEIALYIASVIEATVSNKYSFTNMCSLDNLNKVQILLMVDNSGNPDWDYIEKYIANLEKKLSVELDNLQNAAEYTKTPLSVISWQNFKIEDLFKVVKGTRLTRKDMKEGNRRFVGSSAVNNGITCYVSNTRNIHSSNVLTVAYNGSVGQTFYQEEEFLASDDVNVLYPKFKFNKQIAMYIAPIIKKAGEKYVFINKWKKEDMEQTNIKLPVTSSNEPDWEYMEQYISSLEKSVAKKLDKLQTVVEGC